MATSAELNILTAKQLGSIAKELAVSGWHEMRKDDLTRSIISRSRSKSGSERLKQIFALPKFAGFNLNKSNVAKQESGKSVLPHSSTKPVATTAVQPKAKPKDSAIQATPTSGTPKEKTPTDAVVGVGNNADKRSSRKQDGNAAKSSVSSRDRRKETPRKLDSSDADLVRIDNAALVAERSRLSRDLGSPDSVMKEDLLALTVRGPFWLHIFWQLSSRTIERIKVTMGHLWYTAVPILRIYKIESDAATLDRRRLFREIKVHGGVRHWYVDVTDPPSEFQAELGYLSKEQKFHLLVSSNTVETPSRQIVDDLDKLDDNWREVDENLARIYKLSSNETNNAELKRIFEKQLNRPMSQPLVSRYKSTRQKSISEKTRRNFNFNVDADIIIHGKTDPSVQVTVKNEPITINSDGTFLVRFSIPEKRHVFPIEAESSDGVEVQRVILTMERNTRVLETLFQEHSDDD
ncbi:MAG: DUF4912 domain-containing protein [Planctomycetaceae bacterium]|jgi:hypothetical protein|nr:DUF4912 domain-containing protein [Planctomycetaceae bacterium]